jgi:hypothetical protein
MLRHTLNRLNPFQNSKSTPKYRIDHPVSYEHTPDIVDLEQKEAHLYFAYHCTNNSDPRYLRPAITRDPFQLWRSNNGAVTYPIATEQIPSMRRISCLPVKGRLLLMPTPDLVALDAAARNGVQFVRRRIEVHVDHVVETKDRDSLHELYDYRTIPRRGSKVLVPHGAKVKAFMHVGIQEHWEPQLDGGYSFTTVRKFNEHEDRLKYYQFTRLELDG